MSRGVNMSKSAADLGPNLDPNCCTPGLPLPVSKKDVQLENLRCWKNKCPKEGKYEVFLTKEA